MYQCTVNMINFVRGVEPRREMDLLEPVKKQIELNRKYDIKNTFLVQYDAFVQPCFSELMRSAEDEKTELGLWIEMARPLIEKLGLEWRGRPGFDWDYHVNPGFLMAYTKENRRAIIDELMSEFKRTFGHYPSAVGSWMIDSFSMKYMEENYSVKAYAICREQCGTDGYTLWGGYYSQGYYPSVHNMLCPAQTAENQICVPTFRMLGLDQLHGYDRHQESCITMEPFWEWGKNPDWVDWFMKNQTENEDLGFSYVQIGQENSFGWENYGEALEMQVKKLKLLEAQGKVRFEQLSETGRRFKEKYDFSPPCVVSAYGDYQGADDTAVWYQCKNYRAGLMSEDGSVYLRDIHLFDEEYREEFEDGVCEEDCCTYDTLPVIDGYALDPHKHCGGLYFDRKAKIVKHVKTDNGIAVYLQDISDAGIAVYFDENGFTVKAEKPFSLRLRCDEDAKLPIKGISDRTVSFEHNGFSYSVRLEKGTVCNNALVSDSDGIIRFGLSKQ